MFVPIARDAEDSARFFEAIEYQLDPNLAVKSPILEAGLAAWRELCDGRHMPRPRDIDPLRLPKKILPHIALLEIEHTPVFRLRWRLIGTHITAALGRDSTGRYWDEIYGARAYRQLLTGPAWVVKHRLPVRITGSADFAGKGHIRTESLDLPLSADGQRVDRLMIVSHFTG